MPRRQRLDAELVRRHLVPSRVEAARRIEAGEVLVNGAVADKSSRLVHAGDPIVLSGPPPRYVSRGGEKLHAALERFQIDPRGVLALDAGASTGGFTDCLLHHGAAQVVAVDVGHGQLHPRIRADQRVTVVERMHVRDLTGAVVGAPVDLLVADLSFISLRRVLAPMFAVCRLGATFVLLVKPQFEAGRVEVARGKGVITDPAVHERVRAEIDEALVAAGAGELRWMDSPITGADGNRELLVSGVVGPSGCTP
jgi:23S rRNA (cytidine1920-2'-O)/16S rRNA (cytidine1409-2'-O)-methyltransferase